MERSLGRLHAWRLHAVEASCRGGLLVVSTFYDVDKMTIAI